MNSPYSAASPTTTRRGDTVPLFLLAARILSLCWLPYFAPSNYWPSLGWNQKASHDFAQYFGFGQDSFSSGVWQADFCLLISLATVLHLWLVRRNVNASNADGHGTPTAPIAWCVCAAVVLTAAPAWSCDAYGYAAYGRMISEYGLNPYATPQFELRRLDDALAPYLQWNVPSPYGGLWTALSALITLATGPSPTAMALAFKALAAASLLAAAREAGLISKHLWGPPAGQAAFLAVSLQPLLILESAGNGHNDFLMIYLAMRALRFVAEQRWTVAVGTTGFAAAIKFVPAMMVPWIIIFAARAGVSRRELLMILALPLATLLVLEWSFMPTGPLSGLWAHVSGHEGTGISVGTTKLTLAIGAYAGTTLYLASGSVASVRPNGPKEIDAARLASAFAWVSAIWIVCLTPGWPWYATWAMVPLATQPGRAGFLAFATVAGLGTWLASGYLTANLAV